MDKYHSGEIAVQEITGERDNALMNARVIEDKVPKGAVKFVSQQNYCLLGIENNLKEIWPIFLTGDKGFASVVNNEKSILISLDKNVVGNKNPFYESLNSQKKIGCLFIELSTRRRLRINGYVETYSNDELIINVEQGYPNCPKYIQRREIEESDINFSEYKQIHGEKFTDEIIQWIINSDTLFVASTGSDGSCDISHRGGNTSFIKISKNILRIPDYPGNSMFNTFGNFFENPRAGLLFLDLNNNRQLQTTGEIELQLGVEENKNLTGGTGRWWKFTGNRWVISSLNKGFNWKLIDSSPFNP